MDIMWNLHRYIKHYVYLIVKRKKKYIVMSCTLVVFLILQTDVIWDIFNQHVVLRNNHSTYEPMSVHEEEFYNALLKQHFIDSHSTHLESENSDKTNSKLACVHPKLDPFNQLLTQYFHKLPKLQCAKKGNWVYIDNGTFFIYANSQKLYGDITCDIYPLFRKDDFNTVEGEVVKDIKNGTVLKDDFIRVACESSSGESYTNRHAGVAFHPELYSRTSNLKRQPLDLNVFIMGLDSISRMTSIRKLQKSRDYFVNVLNGIELEGYNIVGDATRAAMFPILTGKTPDELPEIRHGYPGATTADGFPLIWKEYKKSGYLTLWADDDPGIGCFHMLANGFAEQPTDFYLRPFFVAADFVLEFKYGFFRTYLHSFLSLFMKDPPVNLPLCYGSKPKHQYFLDYLKGMFTMYPTKRKFMFGFHGEISHGNNNNVEYMDEDIANLFNFLNTNGYLNDTLLIFMADHGSRFETFRSTVQGKQEERMPLFALRFPPWVEKVYPDIINNLKINSKRLTTPFDIHETLKDILSFSGTKTGDLSKRGISLLNEIPQERTCTHAGIKVHWCACLDWKPVLQTDPVLVRLLHAVLSKLNDITSSHRSKCALLGLKQVVEILKYKPNKNMVEFEHVASRTETFYQVTIVTVPGNGRYETTVRHDLDEDILILDEHDISRTNSYGSQSNCIELRKLLKYCFCKFNKLV
ncbi:uncharacterized protein LOC126828145 [Patella vulgata]|uniref:uncharacterized protein LOC126828145 n=1 Tax=Patella vulgata TaxID=6465 RepID=UPI00218089AA|nr:uncharacterized protein LOC126828145 [Patella vulgata]